MSITTITELQTAINDYLGRSDMTDGQFHTMVALAEAHFNRALRVRQMETSSDLTTTDGVATLPTDYLGFRSVTYNGDPSGELAYVTPTELRARFTSADAGIPVVFTIEDTDFITRPVDDGTTITMRYYKTLPALDDDNTSNWLLTAYPDLYLFATMVEAECFNKNVDGMALWQIRRDGALQELIALDTATKGGGNIRPVTWIV